MCFLFNVVCASCAFKTLLTQESVYSINICSRIMFVVALSITCYIGSLCEIQWGVMVRFLRAPPKTMAALIITMFFIIYCPSKVGA